jgi:hypothetical protein
MSDLSGVRTGVTLILYQIILIILAILLAVFGAVAAGRDARLLGVIMVIAGLMMIGGGICGLIGKFMCMSAPAETEGKELIIASVVCDMIGLLIAVALILNLVPPSVPLNGASNLINLTAQVLFLLFLKKIAFYINRSDLSDKSQSVLNLMVAVIVGGIGVGLLLFLVPAIAALLGLVLLVMLILMVVRYVGLIVEMKAGLERATGV